MGSMTNLVYYVSVSRGSTVLADHKKSNLDLTDVPLESLENKVPPFHNQFTYTVKNHVFLFLVNNPFTYCAVVDEALGKPQGMRLLERVRDEFTLLVRSRGLDPSRLERNALVGDFGGVFKHLVRPLVGVPKQEVDLHDKDHSKDDTALSPPREHHTHPAPLTGNGHHPKVENNKKSTKHQQVVQVKEIMMTNSGKALDKCQKLEGGGTGTSTSDMDGGGSRKTKGRQLASRMWWRNVKLVLILDLVVCCILFAIWLGICKGFKCVKSN